jgi:hypothetical protein
MIATAWLDIPRQVPFPLRGRQTICERRVTAISWKVKNMPVGLLSVSFPPPLYR